VRAGGRQGGVQFAAEEAQFTDLHRPAAGLGMAQLRAWQLRATARFTAALQPGQVL